MFLNFEPVTLESLSALKEFLPAGGTGDCNLSPAALICLAQKKETHFAIHEGTLFLRWRPRSVMPEVYCWPIGGRADGEFIAEFDDYLLTIGREVLLYGNIRTITERLGEILPYRNFSIFSENAWWDYLYERETIASLAGRPMHRKRNFVRRFYGAHPQARVVPLTRELQAPYLAYLSGWLAEREPSANLQAESKAIGYAFDHFEELDLAGAVLMEGETVYGFTYGALCAPGVFAIHIEKADKDCVGAYPALSSGFAALLPDTVTLLNREEDLGVAGLRKAKQDWSPVRMLQKGYVRLLPGVY
ncbi:MAG: DUF2156 domain-containing protein [Duodenibacillus sp.]|nr:DUF2156 domain-containing protein [Duodenibacillus sp.]